MQKKITKGQHTETELQKKNKSKFTRVFSCRVKHTCSISPVSNFPNDKHVKYHLTGKLIRDLEPEVFMGACHIGTLRLIHTKSKFPEEKPVFNIKHVVCPV